MTAASDADRLRKLLSDAGLSQRGAARQLDIDERTMRRYCSGELDVPRVVWLAIEALSKRRQVSNALYDKVAAAHQSTGDKR